MEEVFWIFKNWIFLGTDQSRSSKIIFNSKSLENNFQKASFVEFDQLMNEIVWLHFALCTFPLETLCLLYDTFTGKNLVNNYPCYAENVWDVLFSHFLLDLDKASNDLQSIVYNPYRTFLKNIDSPNISMMPKLKKSAGLILIFFCPNDDLHKTLYESVSTV